MIPARVVLAACLIVAVAVFDCSPARVDWAEAGAQYTHATKPRICLSYFRMKSRAAPLESVKLRPGFKQITAGTSKIMCVLGNHTLHAVIAINAPTEHNCMGAGNVTTQTVAANRRDSDKK
jgi:hypothetical protein